MSSMNVIKDSSGSYIPSSQRPDGTWRKPIRVKDGYVPQEEQPLYVSKGKQYKEYRANVPVGMTESDVVSYRSSEPSTTTRGGASSAMFDVGMFQLPKVAPKIPGLNFVEAAEPEKAPSKNAKKKSKSKSAGAAVNGTAAAVAQPKAEAKAAPPPATATTADPVKRLRNLRKKLKDIESLEKRIASGELENPEKDQMEKIQRKDEVIDEIEDLEHLVDKLNLS